MFLAWNAVVRENSEDLSQQKKPLRNEAVRGYVRCTGNKKNTG